MKKASILFLMLTVLIASPAGAFAQRKKKNQDTPPAESVKSPSPKEKADIKSLEEVTKKCSRVQGLFTLFQDTSSGSTYILVKKDQLDKEYIYFSYTVDGITAAGHFRGNFRDNKVLTIRRYFSKIEFYALNTAFYFDSTSALSKAADANLSHSLIASLPVVAQNKNKTEFLVKADDLFLNEALHQVKPSARPNNPGSPSYSLGSLSKEKCKYLSLKSYPQNTDVIVEYIYDSPSPTVRAGSDVADERYVSIKLQHSLIEMPQDNYEPRYDDPRIGYFFQQKEDMTSASVTPYRDVINRWNLEKKDKNALISEPVVPITWWIENTTPVEYRETIKNAALAWNEAFEKAGFKNAMEVKVQPDDAEWDAGDIRYNVLRWTSSPKPPFGGYGPSFTNPRTGQIIGADIMLEFVFVTNRLKQEKLFDVAGLNLLEEMVNDYPEDKHFCAAGHYLHQTALFGLSSLVMSNAPEIEKREYINSSLYYLILHELGHTLGLNHNMKASQMLSPVQLMDKELTKKIGLTGSVMDYPMVNLPLNGNKNIQYFTTKPGPYDLWAIEFGYSPALDDENAEQERLEKILARSTEPELIFGNDADDMRSPGKGIDPRVNINDLSGDVISYSAARLRLADSLTSLLKSKFTKNKQSYHELRNGYLILTSEANNAASGISRYIGGVYVDRGFAGQPKAGKPFTPVAYKEQKRAMETLKKYVFGSDAFKTPSDLYNYLQIQRRGYAFSSNNEDPRIHQRILNIQRNVLNHLLHPNVMLRITDSELYGNEYKLPEMMNDLTGAIFSGDLMARVNTFRQNLQVEYIKQLTQIINAPESGSKAYDNRARANAYTQLMSIQRTMAANPGTDSETKAHRQYIAYLAKKAIEDKQ